MVKRSQGRVPETKAQKREREESEKSGADRRTSDRLTQIARQENIKRAK